MPKKKDEYPEIKDTSRPSRDAASMKETTGQSQAEWEAIKARGKPTDEEYEARYQSLLKRYNISPDNYKTSKSGAAEYTESTKQEPKSKTEPKTEKSKTSPTKEQKKTTSTSPLKIREKTALSKATGNTQTSDKGTKTPPKNDGKKPPKKDEKKPPKNEDKTPTISDSEQRSYHKPAMEQIADNKPPTHMKYYRGKDLFEVNPISTYMKNNAAKGISTHIKNSAAKGRQQMEERSIKRRTDVSKYSSQSTSKETKETKKKQGKVLTGVTNDDIRLGRSPLTIQAQQTKKKSPLDTILDKEKKKFKYKQ